ncbi:MAG: hypothetical protein FJ117_03940 [Deltaproteobacteria bacterium]|nr:hypothetical protein [Deltaproteobacteria bacterium]
MPDFPNSWLLTELKVISEIILGQSPPSPTYNENGEGLPFYQGKLEFGQIYPVPQKWCSSPKKIAEKGDVLISVRAPVGPTNICPGKSCIGRGLAAIRGIGGISPFFILYLMRAIEKDIAGKGTGTTFNAITGDQLRSIEIPLPPLPEQNRIVAKIEELFTKLDTGVEALKKVKAQIKRYRQAVLKYAFEGKLTQEWREANKDKLEPASILLERIKEERKKKLRWNLDELPVLETATFPRLPHGWLWASVGEIMEVVRGASPRPKGDPRYFGGNIPWIMISDISREKGKYISKTKDSVTEEGAKRSRLLKAGTLILSNSGTVCVPKILAVDGCIHDGFVAFPELSEKINILYFYHFFDHIRPMIIQENKQGVTQVNLNTDIVKRIPVPFLSFSEQQKIIEEIESRFSMADEVEKIAELTLKQSERLRQSILKIAFEGKLVPQDPTDLPADELLKQIKKEREAAMAYEKKRKKKMKNGE